MKEKISKISKKQSEDAIQLLKEKEKLTRDKTKKLAENYKEFAIKGNALDLAIGVVIGSAFTNIVNSIVSTTITPLISFFTNKVDLSTLFIALNGDDYSSLAEAKAAGALTFNYGELLNAFINFFIISFVLFIIVSLIKKSNKKETIVKESSTKDCPYCLNKVPIKASKCGFCTSNLKVAEIVEEK